MNKKQMRKIFMEIINNQIRDNTPPETKQTLDRLISENFSEEEAKEMIGKFLFFSCIFKKIVYTIIVVSVNYAIMQTPTKAGMNEREATGRRATNSS
jgi:hypothetical protein